MTSKLQILWSGNINIWSGKSLEKVILFSMNCGSPDKLLMSKVNAGNVTVDLLLMTSKLQILWSGNINIWSGKSLEKSHFIFYELWEP